MTWRRIFSILLVTLALGGCHLPPSDSRPGARPPRSSVPPVGGTGPLASPPAWPTSPASTPTVAPTPTPSGPAVLLFGIGVHIEPMGETAQGYRSGKMDYGNPRIFRRHVEDLDLLAQIVEAHGGVLTVQAQSPFTTQAIALGDTILADLAARGHEIALHFHEDAHLGKNPETLPSEKWCAVMQEEIGYLRQASGVERIRYWSGGNLYPHLLEAATCAGLEVNSDWKNPRTQTTDLALVGVHPWRPAGSPNGEDVRAFATHDPNGPVIFLPECQYDQSNFASMRRSEEMGGDQAYFDYLRTQLEASLEAAEPGMVNVFHFTVHPGEFRGGPDDPPFAVIERFLTEVVDPLVASGRVRWATFSQMADAYQAWEQGQPQASVATPAASESASGELTGPGYLTFVVNVHDWVHVDQSAATLLRLIDLFQRYGVRGDFYLTAPVARAYAEQYPEVLQRLRESGMTVSYHVRAPHPLTEGFSAPLEGLQGEALRQTILDYETYRLDLATGGLDRTQPGGYTYVMQQWGGPPVAVAASADPHRMAVARTVYAALGARMVVLSHESGTDIAQPFVYVDGLLARPVDFSVTRVTLANGSQNFWWNLVLDPQAADYAPVHLLQTQLNDWWAQEDARPPFILAHIHENNFYRRGSVAWGSYYYQIDAHGNKTTPLAPPFDLNAPDPSTPRSAQEQEAIWQAYEALVAWAAGHLQVVTSADVVNLAAAQSGR